ncbi:MAG: HAD hydrolase family protein [Gemmatimonas sp.]
MMHDTEPLRRSVPRHGEEGELHPDGNALVRRTLLIVADVDGTFLDGSGCAVLSARALRDSLQQLSRRHEARVLLAFASSRTMRELLVLQRALSQSGPCIAEDGALIAVDTSDQVGEAPPDITALEISAGCRRLRVWQLARSASMLRAEFGELVRPYELDASDDRTMRRLGFRSASAVRRALLERQASILLDLDGANEHAHSALCNAAQESGAHVHRGGRWHTVTHGAGKGPALAQLRHLLGAPGVAPPVMERANDGPASVGELRVVAVGNEENDESLLSSADVRFAICNPRTGVHPLLRAVPGVIPLMAEGTRGFVEMLERLMAMPVFAEGRA